MLPDQVGNAAAPVSSTSITTSRPGSSRKQQQQNAPQESVLLLLVVLLNVHILFLLFILRQPRQMTEPTMPIDAKSFFDCLLQQ